MVFCSFFHLPAIRIFDFGDNYSPFLTLLAAQARPKIENAEKLD